jgi:hypothetical protein
MKEKLCTLKSWTGKGHKTGSISSLANFLIVELAVLVLAEQSGSDAGQGVRLEQSKSFLEGVVDVDLAAAADDGDTTGSVLSRHELAFASLLFTQLILITS